MKRWEGPWGNLDALAWTHDGQTLITGGRVPSLRFWDLGGGPDRAVPVPNGEELCDLALSPDGKTLVTVHDGGLRLWGAGDGTVRREFKTQKGQNASVAWSPDGKVFATGSAFLKIVRTVDAATGEPGSDLLAGGPPLSPQVAWSPDGRTLATSDFLWDAVTGRLRRMLGRDQYRQFGHGDWSPDGKTLALENTHPGVVEFWDAATGALVGALKAGWGNPLWSPDGDRIAVRDADGRLSVWRAATGERLAFAAEVPAGVMAWSPSGDRLAYSGDGPILIADPQTGRVLRRLDGHRAPVSAMSWSPDGKTLAAVDGNEELKLWDLATGEAFATLKNPNAIRLWWSSFRFLHSLDGYGEFRTWDTEAESLVVSARCPPMWPVSSTFAPSPDGRTLALCFNHYWLLDTATLRPRGAIVLFGEDRYAVFGSDGNYRGSPRVERLLIAVARTERGQDVYPLDEFAAKFGWTNDPERVRLDGR